MLVRRFLRFSPLFAGAAILGILGVAGAVTSKADGGSAPPIVHGQSPLGANADVHPNRLIVRFKEGVSGGDIQKLNRALGVKNDRAQARSGLHRLELPEGSDLVAILDAYRRSGLVESAGFDHVARTFDAPNDPNYPRQWDLHNTEGGVWAEDAWTLAPNPGQGVVVAVIDTGVAFEQYNGQAGFFSQRFKPAPDLAGVSFVAPRNFLTNTTHANDDNGHGSHVTGTIAQATNNSYGVAGIAYRASIMPLKILDYSGSGSADDLIEAIYYAVDNGARVINMSLGFSGTGAPDASGQVCGEIVGLGAALDYAFSHGVTVVAASGNDGGGTVACPAAYPTVMAVGATRYDGQVTFYSNQGAALDITAPGGDPNVDQNADGYADGVIQETYCLDWLTLLLTGNYDQFCDVILEGTSMASPHVAATAALLLGQNSALTPLQVRYYLETTARDRGAAGRDSAYGWGALDARAALAALGGGPPPDITPTPTPSPTPAPGPAAPTNLAATALSATTIQLTWTDNATNESGYKIERSTNGGSYLQVATVAADVTTYTNLYLSAGTAYSYRVRAYDATYNSAYSNVATATTLPPPDAPSNLVATALSNSSIRLDWADNSTTESGFKIERSTDGVSFLQVATVGAGVTTYTNLYLTAGTTYHFRVRAYDGTVNSGWSNVASTATFPPPAAPTSLAATTLSSSSIRLTWTDNSTTEAGFKIERSTDGVSYLQVATVGAGVTTYTNLYLSAGTAYSFRVRAYEGTANSDWSNVATAATLPPPAAPTNLAATALSASSIKLTWTDNATTETGFKVERSTDGVTFLQVATVGSNITTYTSTSLPAGTTYFFRVRAYEGTSVNSAWSNVASATTLPPPAAPTNLAATGLSPSSIKLTWTDNATNETGFKVERSSDGVTWTQVATLGVNVTTYSNLYLPASTTYSYRVRAYADTANSAYSNVASATSLPPPVAPTNLAATALSATSVKLTWTDNATNETGFKVERSLDGVTWTQVAVLAANTTSWTNYSLTSGTTYYFRVRAYESTSVNSAYSNVATVTTP